MSVFRPGAYVKLQCESCGALTDWQAPDERRARRQAFSLGWTYGVFHGFTADRCPNCSTHHEGKDTS